MERDELVEALKERGKEEIN